jgi:putative FmdB family regulatory protein
MPVYEYTCKHCDNRFEVWRSAEETKKQKCPTCNQVAQKVFHPVGIIFKGSGFHVNDYRCKPEGAGGSKKEAAAACSKAKEKGCEGCGDK